MIFTKAIHSEYVNSHSGNGMCFDSAAMYCHLYQEAGWPCFDSETAPALFFLSNYLLIYKATHANTSTTYFIGSNRLLLHSPLIRTELGIILALFVE